jgi:arylsulfatase A-like enzyme
MVQLDWSVGQILASLESAGLTRDTLVMFSSDNGPVVDDGYRDDAVEKLGDHKPAGPLRGGKYSNFDAGTRVPFLLRWPARVKANQTSGALLSQVDLFGSLAAVTGHKLSDEAAPDSFDTHRAYLGESKEGRAYVVEHAGSLSLIEGNWKYIKPSKGQKRNLTGNELGNDLQPQLYDLEKDLGEQNNLAEKHPERLRAMSDTLERIRAQKRTRP